MNKWAVQGRMVVGREVHDDYLLICEGGKITHVGPKRDGEQADLIVEDGLIAPGYIDVHVHGSNGYDVMDGTEEALRGMAHALAGYGVTGFLATTLTGDLEHLSNVLATCRQFADGATGGALLLGIHLEGPWINAKHKGAQNGEHVVAPATEAAKRLLEAAGGLLKIVTLAPEQPQALDVIELLEAHGVRPSVGHSDATYEHVKDAIGHGLAHVTHCYNAMRGLHHREPGVVGAAMYHDELTTELIADGLHVHPVAMSILYRLKQSDGLVLVSDGMRAVGMEDGDYDLGGLPVQMRGGEARLADGTLAGSTLTLDQAVRNMVRYCAVPVGEAIAMASETPSKVIGVADRKGKLQVGYDADFLILDNELNVQATYIGGRIVE